MRAVWTHRLVDQFIPRLIGKRPLLRERLPSHRGSCPQFTIMPLQPIPTKPAPVSASTDVASDGDANLACDTGDEFEFFDRRFYLVNTTGEAPGLIQWVAPIGTMTPICKLRPISNG